MKFKMLAPMMALCVPALLLPVTALAELTELSVQFTGATEDTWMQGDTVPVNAIGNGDGMEYRYALWRMGAEPVQVLKTGWSSQSTFDIVTGSVLTPSGHYRVLVTAREVANPEQQLVSKANFRVVTAEEITAQLQARYTQAIERLREELARVIRRKSFGINISKEFGAFASDWNLIYNVLNPEGHGAQGGGNAFVSGAADDNRGAIGVEIIAPPLAEDDWRGTEVVLHMPAYLGTTATSTTISYDTSSERLAQIQVQRDLVMTRYNEAVSKTRDALLRVIRRQGAGLALDADFVAFSSAYQLIDNTLNPFRKNAPEGGLAIVGNRIGDTYTGAIGVEIVYPPADLDDWWGTSVRVHLPAFLGLTAQSTTINYDTVLPEAEVQAQRDKVLSRYNTAIKQVKKTFAEVRSGLAAETPVSDQFFAMSSADEFITRRLSASAIAPRSGPAYRADLARENDLTGAIGVVVEMSPNAENDWAGTTVSVHLPAFLGLTAATTVITFDD